MSAARIELKKEHTSTIPFEVTIKNSKYVKLGMDSDWWEFPALMLGIALAVGGAVTFVVVKRKRTKKSEV